MRPTPVVLRLALCLSAVAPTVLAWPEWLPARDSLVVRQDNGNDESSSAAETGASATRKDPEPTKEAEKKDADGDKKDEEDDGDLNTAKPTSKASGKETATPTSNKPKSSKSVPHDAAVGAANIQEPATTAAATPLYKIGDNVTLSWNYTGLINEPTAIDVLLSCSTATATWTLTANMSFASEVNYIWDSRKQENDGDTPLLTEMYTLIIKDSEAEISDPPSPGELGAYADFQFGMYTPVPYTPWPDWECTVCNSASGNFDAQVVKLAFTMSFITVFTFTWFVTGWGLE